MHELSATQNMIQMVRTECTKRKITNPNKIIIDLGGFSSYSKESLLFYFDILKRDEPSLRKTKLIINEIPGRIICTKCKKEQTIEDACMMLCPECHSTDIQVIRGKEFILKEIQTMR
jgi:hydrogenase nickel insertion protein HypA